MTDTEFFQQFEKIRQYSYYTAVLDYVSDYLDEHKDYYREHNNYDVEDIIDCMAMSDDVTGNASGSFYCSRWKAQCCLFGNENLLDTALMELGYTDLDGNVVPTIDEPETKDVIVRIYVLTINARDEVEELITKAYPWLDEADSSEEE